MRGGSVMNLLFTVMNTRIPNGILLCTSIDNSKFKLWTRGRSSQKIKEKYIWSTTLPPKKWNVIFYLKFWKGNQRTEKLRNRSQICDILLKKKKRRTYTNSAIPYVACFSVIVVYFRNEYRDNLAFYFKEKIYGS